MAHTDSSSSRPPKVVFGAKRTHEHWRREAARCEIDPNVWSGRALQEVFVELADVRSCINVSGL